MKLLPIVALFTGLHLAVLGCGAQTPCRVGIEEKVEVIGPALRLADVLSPDTCPDVISAAARMSLGAVPADGSVRVLRGTDVTSWLQAILGRLTIRVNGPRVEQIPERIVVRLAGFYDSCGDIRQNLLSEQGSASLGKFDATSTRDGTSQKIPDRTDCGLSGVISTNASFELDRKVWDPALRSWIFFARCRNPRACVPFIVRVQSEGPQVGEHSPYFLNTQRNEKLLQPLRHAELAKPKPIMRRGQVSVLLWEQDGIRLTVPVVCLENGGKGEMVHTRVLSSGRVVRAIVLSREMLKAL